MACSAHLKYSNEYPIRILNYSLNIQNQALHFNFIDIVKKRGFFERVTNSGCYKTPKNSDKKLKQ